MNFFEVYSLIGKVTIPKDRQDELNDNVLKLLDRSGVRKIEKMTIEGTETEVAARVKPDDKGIVSFDYSIYENRIKDIYTYDMKTSKLEVNECGFQEMGASMVLVLILIESYSSTPCYVARENRPISITNAAGFIEELLGIKLSFPHRPNSSRKKKLNPVPFYKVIQRDNDDEALGEFSDRELAISNEMKEVIKGWREQVEGVSVSGMDYTLEDLKTLMISIKDDWNVRRMDSELFNELKDNINAEGSKKAVFLLKSMDNDGVDLFPELTENQAKKWILKRCRGYFDKQKFNGLLGLLANKEKRMELLGF